jgi:hypothetical protein
MIVLGAGGVQNPMNTSDEALVQASAWKGIAA